MLSLRQALGTAVVLVLGACSAAPAGDGIAGRLVAVDDTGLRDVAIDGGWIAALPLADADGLWRGGGLAGEPGDLGHVEIPIDDSTLSGVEAVVAPVDERGRFRLAAPPGPTLICQLRPAGTGEHMITRGCAALDMPEAGLLMATFGEGGFFVEAS
ncbi:hypothetical protein IC607_12500 [Cellulomonas sp. JH27-2]|uniref:hypothetical protein n=1 Tax=Cellulomonas sp. JH27-2 TaxID=2774139 RepID=UPI001784D6E8|nr:hypothetical protein [Cellulomonas sp. JH27-2]MBD8059788.1 hypothetical protein [Cellulomonas sp. JH27-2]